MSPFGLFHTAVSVLPVGLGVLALARDDRIDPRNRVGRLYLATMRVSSLTALGLIPALPYAALRDLVLSHPTVAEGLGAIFPTVPSPG